MRRSLRAATRTLFACTLMQLLSLPAAAERPPQGLLASADLDPAAPVTRLAFGSCFKVSRGGEEVWRAVLEAEPDLFLFAGDTVYADEDSDDSALPSLREAYSALAAVEPFSALRAQVPVVAVWDDHDYGMQDGGADFPAREASEALFEAVWGIEGDDPRLQREGVYHSLTLGPEGQRLQLILLDTRFFRSPLKPTDKRGKPGRERYLPDPDPAKTLLGERQWVWLEEQFAAPAELRILVSSIQVLAEGHGWESWKLLPRERERLLSLLRRHADTPTLMLSGDRHFAGFYRRDRDGAAPLLEFTSSALNNTVPQPFRARGLREAGPLRLGELYGEENFGLLDIDWPARRMTLSLRDPRGGVVRNVYWNFASGAIEGG